MDTYLVAITPPPDTQAHIQEYRRRVTQYTGYKIPPHITLYPPFYLQNTTLEKMVDSIRTNLDYVHNGTVRLADIDSFTGYNNVIFFKPDDQSTTYLKNIFSAVHQALSGRVTDRFSDYAADANKFVPHLTIAERVPNGVWQTLQTQLLQHPVDISFPVNTIGLYEQAEDSREWRLVNTVTLENNFNSTL
jgi:2'-5' RNA ligase